MRFSLSWELTPKGVEIPSGIKAYEVGVRSRLLQPMQIMKRVKVVLEKELMNYC
jgi:hypothetical protein